MQSINQSNNATKIDFESRDVAVKPQPEIMLPDGTKLRSLINNNDISNEFMDKFSSAIGRVEPGVSSKIHIHPVVMQVTFVLCGTLTVRMKGKEDKNPYEVIVRPLESVVTEPHTFFQLVNNGNTDCVVTYTANPAFLFECDDVTGEIIYNDVVVLDESWEELSKVNWVVTALQKNPIELEELRNESKLRLIAKKGNSTNKDNKEHLDGEQSLDFKM